jgi:hypothetical protein
MLFVWKLEVNAMSFSFENRQGLLSGCEAKILEKMSIRVACGFSCRISREQSYKNGSMHMTKGPNSVLKGLKNSSFLMQEGQWLPQPLWQSPV